MFLSQVNSDLPKLITLFLVLSWPHSFSLPWVTCSSPEVFGQYDYGERTSPASPGGSLCAKRCVTWWECVLSTVMKQDWPINSMFKYLWTFTIQCLWDRAHLWLVCCGNCVITVFQCASQLQVYNAVPWRDDSGYHPPVKPLADCLAWNEFPCLSLILPVSPHSWWPVADIKGQRQVGSQKRSSLSIPEWDPVVSAQAVPPGEQEKFLISHIVSSMNSLYSRTPTVISLIRNPPGTKLIHTCPF